MALESSVVLLMHNETDAAETKMSFNFNGTTFTFTGGTLDQEGLYLDPADRLVHSVPL